MRLETSLYLLSRGRLIKESRQAENWYIQLGTVIPKLKEK